MTDDTMTDDGPRTQFADVMDQLDLQAIEAAQLWITNRRDVRSRLIKLARANHPPRVTNPDNRYQVDANGISNNVIRKLYDYPSDLTDAVLLDLALTTSKGE